MKFDHDTPLTHQAPRVPFKEAERESSRSPTKEDWSIPLLCTLTFGVFVMILVAVVSLGVRATVREIIGKELDWATLVGIVVVIGMAAMLRLYWWFLVQTWSDLNIISTVERVIGVDLNRDGYQGPPPPQVHYELQVSPTQVFRGSLPGPDAVIRAWASAALDGGSMAYDTWNPRFGYVTEHNKQVEVYRKFRKVITSGHKPLAMEHGTHSIALTKRGVDLFSALVATSPEDATPLLDGSAGVSRLTSGDETDTWEGE